MRSSHFQIDLNASIVVSVREETETHRAGAGVEWSYPAQILRLAKSYQTLKMGPELDPYPDFRGKTPC